MIWGVTAMYDLFGTEFNSLILSLVIAAILGGAIGFERERTKVPAGFRTHVLVTIGAALVMAISKYIAFTGNFGPFDPQRLGAQVISGIGFLGAGTIIRYKASVKGLTTAAGLWASACVGLACGIGFYLGAVVATVIILITLVVLKKIEKKFLRKNIGYSIEVFTHDQLSQLNSVIPVCKKLDIDVSNISMLEASVKFTLASKSGVNKEVLVSALHAENPSIEIL